MFCTMSVPGESAWGQQEDTRNTSHRAETTTETTSSKISYRRNILDAEAEVVPVHTFLWPASSVGLQTAKQRDEQSITGHQSTHY